MVQPPPITTGKPKASRNGEPSSETWRVVPFSVLKSCGIAKLVRFLRPMLNRSLVFSRARFSVHRG
jgi:hypothetical protein